MAPDLPLRDVRVLDLTRNVAGPFAAMILAEFGADVVKVEHPVTGDDARHWGPPFWGDDAPIFLALNRNKRSLALDLKEPDGPPVRTGTSPADMGTGMWAALAILAGLEARRRHGRGQRIVTSLYETTLMWMTYHIAAYWASGVAPQRMGSGSPMIAPYESFATRDGHLMIAAGNDRLFGLLCRVLGHPEWAEDARFRHNADRVRHRAALHAAIESVSRERTTGELAASLDRAGVPAAPIRSVAEVATDPQAQALGIFQTAPHPAIPHFRSVGLPIVVDGERPALRRRPPARGEHTGEILAELGFAPGEVAALLRSRAVRGAAEGDGWSSS